MDPSEVAKKRRRREAAEQRIINIGKGAALGGTIGAVVAKRAVLGGRVGAAAGALAGATVRARKEQQLGRQILRAYFLAAVAHAPTEGQRKAGNYRKGHIRIRGLQISIENPAGSKRRPEWPTLTADYGYIRGTRAGDGDQLDVFVVPGTSPAYRGPVFVVNQVDRDGKFDEPKVILGEMTADAARRRYLSNFTPGWQVGPITMFPTIEGFKRWLAKADLSKPVSQEQAERACFFAAAYGLRDPLTTAPGWDVRDGRGKSARVFAPGSRPRERREKHWHERAGNMRLIGALATVAAGGAGIAAGSRIGARRGVQAASAAQRQARSGVAKKAAKTRAIRAANARESKIIKVDFRKPTAS